jgi:endoglucanase
MTTDVTQFPLPRRRAWFPLGAAAQVLLACACSSPGPGVTTDEAAELPSGGVAAPGSAQPLPPAGAATPPDGAGMPLPGAEQPVVPELPKDLVLEDFADGDASLSSEGFAGPWRTYSDGTSTIDPVVDAPIVPVDGVIHVSGSGFNPSGTRAPVDLSEFRGLSIRARGTGVLAIEVVIPATTGTEEGGTCTGDGCFAHYAGTLPLGADFADTEILFSSLSQPGWGQPVPLDLTQVLAINFLARAEGAPANLDLYLDGVTLLATAPPSAVVPSSTGGGSATVNDGTNPFAGRTLSSDGGAAFGAYDAAQGPDRDLLAKVALNPSAYWFAGGDPTRAGSIANGPGGEYAVIVAYNIPNRDCNGASGGGAGSDEEYRGWIDAMANSLQGKEAAIILEPDSLALDCGPTRGPLLSYAVSSLRANPGVAVYIDGGHSSWVPAGEMANRLLAAGIEQATGFAVNVSNFQPTEALINYGRSLSAQVGNKPFVIDTSRNGQGARTPGDWCNPAGAGLGQAPTAATGDSSVHALLWVKRPGESDGPCGQCAGTPAGQFCTSYALELARNAVF